MGLLKTILSIIISVWIYRYLTRYPERVRNIKYIGNFLVDQDPLLVIIIVLVMLNLLL